MSGKISWQIASRYKIWVAVFLFIGVGISMLIGFGTLLDTFLSQSLCGNTIRQEVLSPDRKLKAVIFERECGATTATSTQISLVESSQKSKGVGNVFIIGSTYGTITAPVTHVSWRSNEKRWHRLWCRRQVSIAR